MGMILAGLVSVFVALVKEAIFRGKRLTGAQFAASVVVSFVLWCSVWSWFCSQWTRVAVHWWGDWWPAWVVDFFYPWELVVAPFVDCLILYSAIFFYLKLLNYPDGLDRAGIVAWRRSLKRKFLAGIALFEVLYVSYLVISRLVV